MSLGEVIKITANQSGELKLSCSGDQGSYEWVVSKPNILEFKSSEVSKSAYHLGYLVKALKAAKQDFKECKIEFSTNEPIRVSFLENKESKSKIEYYLAPRVSG